MNSRSVSLYASVYISLYIHFYPLSPALYALQESHSHPVSFSLFYSPLYLILYLNIFISRVQVKFTSAHANLKLFPIFAGWAVAQSWSPSVEMSERFRERVGGNFLKVQVGFTRKNCSWAIYPTNSRASCGRCPRSLVGRARDEPQGHPDPRQQGNSRISLSLSLKIYMCCCRMISE